jgi:hypothetical protein
MSHRRQSFCCILSLQLLLSKKRRSSPLITNGAAPASPPEPVYSRPAVGLFVPGHRQRAQEKRKHLPAILHQAKAWAFCYRVRLQFRPRGRDTLFSAAPTPAFSVASRLLKSSDIVRSGFLRAAPGLIGRLLSAPGSKWCRQTPADALCCQVRERSGSVAPTRRACRTGRSGWFRALASSFFPCPKTCYF